MEEYRNIEIDAPDVYNIFIVTMVGYEKTLH